MRAEKQTELSIFRVWLLAARPKTLPAAAAPVIVGSAVAYSDNMFRIGPALAALLGALLLQIGANLANDVFDYFKGADATERLGPVRVTQAGLLLPEQVMRGMWVVFGLAAMIGAYLILVAGWPVLLVGMAAIATAIAYTGGPFPFGYHGLGDFFVFVFFGLVAVCGTYFVQAGTVSWLAVWSSVPIGFLITGILVVNNLRDIDSDRAVGKKTLAVRLGVRGARWEFGLLVLGAYLIPVVLWTAGMTTWWIMLSWLSIPLAVDLVRTIWKVTGMPLNEALASAGRLTLVYSVFYALGLILQALL